MQIGSMQQLLPVATGKQWTKNRARRGKSKIMEQIDLYLEGLGLYRKQTARDATCLFRAVSEQIFYSQCFHNSVRLSCIHFMERNRLLFPTVIDGEQFEDHARRMQSPREWGGQWEMQAMSILYKRDFIIFTDINSAPVQVTDNNFSEKIILCQIGQNHFDSVFPKSFIDNTAICQGLVYELLYGEVYGMEDIDAAIQVMLYEGKSKNSTNQSLVNLLKENERPNSVVNVLVKGGTPFPYKVAKALDPRMYRNVEFDLWNDERKETKKKNIFHNEILQIGSKCLVTIDEGPNPTFKYPAYIQDMQPDKGPVSVFVEVLGKRCVVSYENIEPIVLPQSKARCICINGSISGSLQQAVRFRRHKPGRLLEPKSLREAANNDKIQCTSTPNSKAQSKDLNNNSQTESPGTLWSPNSNNMTISTSVATANSMSSLESPESATDSDSPEGDLPFYYMTPSNQWGSYQSVAACPPPQIPYPFSPTPVHVPTPVYVTFSDGTTVVVPSHARPDPAQSASVMYFDPSTNPQSYGQQISFVGPEMEQSNDNMNLSMDQVLHDESLSVDRSSFEAQGPNFSPVSPHGYWTAEQPQVMPGGFCPPLAYQNSQVVNGEMGPMTLYFSPPYPYPVNH